MVTKFFAVSLFPLIPLASYYISGHGELASQGIPVHMLGEDHCIYALPLARIDRLSAATAYFRGFCGLLVVAGFISIVPLIMMLTGEHLDDLATFIFRVLLSCLAAGIVFGILSYMMPLNVSSRERDIRQYCGEYLGICADPAIIRADIARGLVADLPGDQVNLGSGHRWIQVRRLVQARVTLANCATNDPASLVAEHQADEILSELKNLQRNVC